MKFQPDVPFDPALHADEVWIRPEVTDVVSCDNGRGKHFRFVLDRDAELRIDRGVSGAHVVVRVEQDATGSRTLTPNAAIVFRNGETGFNLPTAAGSVTILHFFYDEAAQAFECATWLTRTRADALYAGAGSYQPLDATLTAMAGVTTAANKAIYFTGVDVAAAFDLTAAGRALIDDADATAQRATLGLGNSATKNVGTSAGTVAAGDDARFASGAGRLLVVTLLTASSGTHVLNADTTAYRLRMFGGGGGGGGASSAAASGAAGAGGAGGAYAEKWVTGATGSGVMTFLIGAAGTGGANTGADGGTGGDTKWDKDPGGGGASYELTAPGGSGGAGMTAVAAGTFKVSLGGGQGGGSPEATDSVIRATGSCGGNGVILDGSLSGWSGHGGSCGEYAGPRGRANVGASGESSVADGYGTGGAGGLVINGSGATTGGAGTQGCIIIEEFAL